MSGPTSDVSYPRLRPEDIPQIAQESLPAVVPDPFAADKTLDLSAAQMPNFNLVDGTVAIATDPQMPFVLFKGYSPDTWFYAPRWGRIAKNPDGEPAFMVSKKVRNNPDGSKTTLGGILSFMVELVVELPSEAQRQQWTNLIKTLYNLQPASGVFNFQPLRLNPGTMNVYGLDQYARPGQPLKNVQVGSSSSIAFAIDLTPDGADHFAAMLGASPLPYPPQVAIMFDYTYQYLIPQCRIQASGFKKKCYDYFSWNAKARASYFGLVNGSFDYQSVRADLRQQQALNVSVIGQPPTGVDLSKLLDSIFDLYLKTQVGEWIQPDPKPVEASAPGGFFGGVSVAMKDVSLSDTEQFDETLDFAGIGSGIHQVSFNFEQQLGSFDPHKHLFIEEDDIKLPFIVSIQGSPLLQRVSTAATYTTSLGPRTVQVDAVSAEGGQSKGIIQFTPPQRPTSAQIDMLVDLQSPYIGYEYKLTQPVSDSGACFPFWPDAFMQRTNVIFVDPVTVVDKTSKALFTWEWTPPANIPTPRPKVSGYFVVGVDPNATYNLPTCDIDFPYSPNDWTGETTPKILYKLQGLTGDWRGRSFSGAIQLGTRAISLQFDGSSTVGSGLAGPAGMADNVSNDPTHRERLLATYGPPPSILGSPSAAEGHPPGGGFIPPDRIGPPEGGGGGMPPQRLGYQPDTAGGEPQLYERELIATARFESAGAGRGVTAGPAEYDLRDVYGQNFVTPVRNQGYCGSCVAFGTTATVESTLQVRRKDPGVDPDFSEAHLFYCLGADQGRTCGNVGEANGGWFPSGALDAWRDDGVADEGCFPYAAPASGNDPTPPCAACDDASSRTTTIDGWSLLQSTDDMKSYIAGDGQGGPLTACFTVYQDFYDFFQSNPTGVYRKSSSPGALHGGHCICVIGYSDNEQAWICKNSWGTWWAASGFFKIGYGEVGIDAYMWAVDIS